MSETKDNEELVTEKPVKTSKKWWKIIGIAALIALIALMLWQDQPWSKETTVNGDLHVTGNLVVDKDATIKGQVTAGSVLSETDILAKRDIVAENVVQGRVVQATEKMVTPEIDTNKVVTQTIETTNKPVAIQTVTPVINQTGSGDNSSTTTVSTSPTISNYAETGKGTPNSYTLVVETGNIGIVGGYNVNRIPNGVYRAYGPGTYKIDITDGFIYEVDQAHALAEFESRVATAKNNGWACATIDYGPLK